MKRRTFLQSVTAIPALANICSEGARGSAVRVRYVCHGDRICVLRSESGSFVKLQAVLSRRPVFLQLSSRRDVLFAVNAVDEVDGVPTGSIESYAIDCRTGRLKAIGRRALSLSSTSPRHCALSPDGRYLVVAAYGGGTYNVLPILEEGRIGPVSHAIKEIGRSVDPVKQASAHPHSLVFHPSGRFVIGTDLGSDRINVFRFEHGRLLRAQRKSVPPGRGPAEIVMNATGTAFTIRYELKRSIGRYRFNHETAEITEQNCG